MARSLGLTSRARLRCATLLQAQFTMNQPTLAVLPAGTAWLSTIRNVPAEALGTAAFTIVVVSPFCIRARTMLLAVRPPGGVTVVCTAPDAMVTTPERAN